MVGMSQDEIKYNLFLYLGHFLLTLWKNLLDLNLIQCLSSVENYVLFGEAVGGRIIWVLTTVLLRMNSKNRTNKIIQYDANCTVLVHILLYVPYHTELSDDRPPLFANICYVNKLIIKRTCLVRILYTSAHSVMKFATILDKIPNLLIYL